MATALTRKSETLSFGGTLGVYRHPSHSCDATLRFAIYLPPQAQTAPVPVLYFLSGLTCTEENFMTKAGAQQFAAKYGIALVSPDTSPRDTNTPGEDNDWDFGTGAGFYIDATQMPWRSHYNMYSYITRELPELIAEHFPVDPSKQGIFGHSMGGHGALICALKNPQQYQSVSAFAPIVAPTRCPWGQKAFRHYLGEDEATWRDYDASELVLQNPFSQTGQTILIDQGKADQFLEKQLMPQVFQAACAQVGQALTLRMQPGYDHSYYFIASFMEDHIRHHAAVLQPISNQGSAFDLSSQFLS